MKKKIAIILTVCLILSCGVTSVSASVTDGLSTGWHQLIDFLGLGKEDKTPTPEGFDEASLIEKVNYLESTVVKKSDLTELATKKDFVDSIPEEKDDTVGVINCEYTQYIDDSVAEVSLPEKKADATQYTWKEIYNILTAHKAEDYDLGANTHLADGWTVLEGDDYSLQVYKHLDSAGKVTYDVAEATAQGYWSTFNANAGIDIASLGYLPNSIEVSEIKTGIALPEFDDFWQYSDDWLGRKYRWYYDDADGLWYDTTTDDLAGVVVVLSLHGQYDSVGLPAIQQDTTVYTWEEIQAILAADAAPVYGLNRKFTELRDSYCVLDSRRYSLKIVAPRREDMQFLDVAKKICRTQYLDFNSEIGVNLAYKSQLPLPRDFKGLWEGFNFGTLHCSWTALKDFEGLHTESDKTQFSLVDYGSYFSLNYEDEVLRYIPTYWIGEKKDYLPRIKESTKYSWREISIILEEGLAAEYGIAKEGTQLRDGWVTTRCRYVDGQNYLHIWKPTTEFRRGNLYRAFDGLVDKYNQEFGYPVVFDINVPTVAELTTDALASYRKSASHVDFWLADAGTDSTDDKETHLYVKADGSIASSPIDGNIIHYVMPVLYLY